MRAPSFWLSLLLLPVPSMAGHEQAHLVFARAVLEQIRGGEAAPWREEAWRLDPDAWPLAQRVAAARQENGDLAGAQELYRQFAATHPAHLGAQIAYADFLRAVHPRGEGAAREAQKFLERALTSHPDELEIIRRLFQTHEQLGAREHSRALFERVMQLENPLAVLAAESMARVLFPAEDADARARLDQAFLRSMHELPGHPGLAQAASEHFRAEGNLARAIEMLEAHAAARPDSLEMRVRLGILYFAADRAEDGRRCLAEVLVLDPGQTLAHQALAKFFRRRGEIELARPHAAEVLRRRGGDAGDFVALAREFLSTGEAREARILLEKARFDHPGNAEVAALLAIASFRDPEGRDAAAENFRVAFALSGDGGPARQPEFRVGYAEFLIADGRGAEAEEELRRAIQEFPAAAAVETARALRLLAGLWEEEGRNLAAAAALKRRAATLDKTQRE